MAATPETLASRNPRSETTALGKTVTAGPFSTSETTGRQPRAGMPELVVTTGTPHQQQKEPQEQQGRKQHERELEHQVMPTTAGSPNWRKWSVNTVGMQETAGTPAASANKMPTAGAPETLETLLEIR
jgi:hypothetical protein